MLTISRSQLKRLRVVFRRALGISGRSAAGIVSFQPHDDGVQIAVVGSDVAIAYQHPESETLQPFAVPLELFKRCEGTRDEPVTLTRHGGEIVSEWTDAGIPQVARFTIAEPEELLSMPDAMQANGPELLSALRDAVETADRESTRYALNCLRLRGHDGQIAATDGRQLLLQDGFTFPWDDEVLVPASRVFASADLNAGHSFQIGKTDDWVTLKGDLWTIHLRVEKEARFPHIDDHLPQTEQAPSTLHLSDADAQFLTKAVSRLPASEDFNAPVTVDLNGAVSIRAKAADQTTATELVLTASRRDGDAVKFSTNREYLARAARLDFRSVQVFGPETPACCREGNRAYVWALLGKEGVIKSDPEATRIESSPATSAKPQPRTTNKRRNTRPMPQANNNNSHHHNDDNGNDQQSASELLDAAEQLKTSLRDSLTHTTTLIAGLKRHRQQSKRIRSAVLSLKQLQAIDA